jgi:hypothetical protein
MKMKNSKKLSKNDWERERERENTSVLQDNWQGCCSNDQKLMTTLEDLHIPRD